MSTATAFTTAATGVQTADGPGRQLARELLRALRIALIPGEAAHELARIDGGPGRPPNDNGRPEGRPPWNSRLREADVIQP
ncbi:hypothetical protein [Patulibacter defluvii]|uniref:hypothetical protein n=1 Tax=Patulibacter defluvii TaxID=3095358 RepID=UPI002A756593|nr:hypothetical protein [Patulibacter sp. DM4]